MASHVVGNQRHRHAKLLQFPGGETGALQERPRFVHIDMDAATRVVRGADNAQGSAVVDCCQCTRVAVCQDAGATRHQVEAKCAHLSIRGDIVLSHLMRQRQHGGARRGDPIFLGDHPRLRKKTIYCPLKIYGCRPSIPQERGNPLHVGDKYRGIAGRVQLSTESHTVGGGNADGGCSADLHGPDGMGDFLGCSTGDEHGCVGQTRLIDEDDGALPLVKLKCAHGTD